MKKILFGLFLFNFILTFSQEIESIKIDGSKDEVHPFLQKFIKLNKPFLIRLVKVKVGQPLDSVKIFEDIKKLRRLNGVSFADYTIKKMKNGKYELTYRIKENYTLLPSFGADIEDEEISYSIGLHERNFTGRNMTIGGFYRNSQQRSTFGFTMIAPYLLSNKSGLAYSYRNYDIELYFNDEGKISVYESFRTSNTLGYVYEKNFRNNFYISASYSNVSYNYLHREIYLPKTFFGDDITFRTSYVYNNITNRYQYKKGIRNSFGVSYLSTDNPFKSNSVYSWNSTSYYKRIGLKGNWANRIFIGLATNNSSIFSPFGIGSEQNLRGIGNRSERNSGNVIFNTEYRYTLVDYKWFVCQSSVFVDTGLIRPAGQSFAETFGEFYTGVGLRFMHKRILNGIIRFDYPVGAETIIWGFGQFF